MFDGGAIGIEILFFDNEVIAEHILSVLLYKSIQLTESKNYFLYDNPICDTYTWNEQRNKSEMRKRVKQ